MRRSFFFVAAALCGLAPHARAADPVVDIAWLKASDASPGTVIVDLRPRGFYLKGHIPGAVSSDYVKDKWRDEDKHGTAAMLPDPAVLEKKIGALGIDNSSHVVLVRFGQSTGDMAAATRVYWTFKVLGHDRISILDGGMAAYTAEKKADKETPVNPLERGARQPTPKVFKAVPGERYIATAAEVARALSSGGLLVDSRPTHQYLGVAKSGKVARFGTLPGATSLPGLWLTDNDGATFRDREALGRLYVHAGVATDSPQINFCNTGHWASLGWFVSSELMGNPRVKLYDGSMTEWAAEKVNPVERKVPLD